MLKSVFIILVFVFFSFSIRCQTVTNMRVFEENGRALVVYDLFSAEEKQFFIRLMSSQDNGNSYKLINNTLGDANKFVKWGPSRAISFPLEKDTSRTNYLFKVLAFPEKSITDYYNNAIKVNLLSVERIGKVVNFNVRIKSNESAKQIIIGNHFGKGLTGNILKEWSVLEGSVKTINAVTGTYFTIQLINEESTDFENIGFNIQQDVITFKSFSVGFRNEGID